MRNLFVLPIVLVGLLLNCDTFAASARGTRGVASANTATSSTTNSNGSVAARAARKTTAVAPKNTGTVAARAAKTQTATSNSSGAKVQLNTTVNSASLKNVTSARAASSQKVIQTGSKVATATQNTVVSQECQDAFFGCMDAFCMLDNVSGGRCQCSDRSAELDKVLDDILKLDEQTYIMATEGVERLQMGEAETEIMARAKAAADKVSESKEDNKKKARTLDLSAWNSDIFGDDADDIFSVGSLDGADSIKDKTGDALYKSASAMCVDRIPAQCKANGSMLQMIYAQKIKSDCVAYENSLKQQKNASQQKLQTAQKALRDAALEAYQNENKYDAGQCTTRFSECMRGADVCDSDYTGCVVLAAKENAKGAKAKQTTIKGELTNITLAATTMEQLLAKKEICMYVTKQCVNANKNDAVWNLFLREAAPALKSAEEIAEQKLRMSCIPTLTECFQNACKANFGDGDSYDACLTNPETYKSLCKVQLEPCLTATGGSYDKPTNSTLWNSLLNALAAMKVDACTKQITECLTADTACGKDYSGCVGLSTEDIVDLCPTPKLTACQGKDFSAEKYFDGTYENEDPVKQYVDKIATGLALNIDNNMLLTCQNALNQAVISVCGDTESCNGFVLDNSLGTSSLQYQICQFVADKGGAKINTDNCKASVDLITNAELGESNLMFTEDTKNILLGTYMDSFSHEVHFGEKTDVKYSVKENEGTAWVPYISGQVDFGSAIEFADTAFVNKIPKTKNIAVNSPKSELNKLVQTKLPKDIVVDNETYDLVQNIVDSLNTALDRIVNVIESDAQVSYCMKGRSVQTSSSGRVLGKNAEGKTYGRFENLTKSAKEKIALQLYNSMLNNYNKKLAELQSQRDKDYLTISEKVAEVAGQNDEKQAFVRRKSACEALTVKEEGALLRRDVTARFNEAEQTCSVTKIEYKCEKPNKKATKCLKWYEPEENTEVIKM